MSSEARDHAIEALEFMLWNEETSREVCAHVVDSLIQAAAIEAEARMLDKLQELGRTIDAVAQKLEPKQPWELSDYVAHVLSCAAAAGDEYAGWSVESIVADVLHEDPNCAAVTQRIREMRGSK